MKAALLKKFTKIKFIYLFWIVFYFFIFALLLKGGFSYLDPDLGWHLRVGEEISRSKQVPKINNLNFSYTGSWVDHEWLSNYLIHQIYSNFGYISLVFVFALIILFVLILLNYFTQKAFKDKTPFFIIASLQLAGVLASMSHFGVRVQELSLLFLLILLIIINKYNKKRHWKYLLALLPLFFIWANLHASFLLGLGILLAFIIVKAVEPWLSNRKKSFFLLDKSKQLNSFHLSIFTVFSLLSLIITFLTPYGFSLYTFLGGYSNRAYLSLISEWLPLYNIPLNYLQLLYTSIAALALISLLYLSFKRRKEIDLWVLFISTVFLVLALSSRRHFPLFFIASFPLLAISYGRFFKKIELIRPYRLYLKVITIVLLLLLTSVQFIGLKFIKNPFEYFCDSYPCVALNFLELNPKYLEGNLFNNYAWGGYLNYKLEKKIFIDGRLPQVKLANHTFIEEYADFFKEKIDKPALLNYYKIETVLIPATNKKLKLSQIERWLFNIKDESLQYNNYLRQYLSSSDEWDLVYCDHLSHIYSRKKF